jgi:prolipoprotein diacylglyceryltransferase
LIRKKIKKPGLLALIILAWTSLSRFITDFFRNDDLPLANFKYANAFISSNYHLASWLTLNQLAYFLVFLVAFSWIIYTFTVDGYCEPEEGFAGKRSPEKER